MENKCCSGENVCLKSMSAIFLPNIIRNTSDLQTSTWDCDYLMSYIVAVFCLPLRTHPLKMMSFN